MSALPFHEKAGLYQQLLWLGKFISDVFLCPDIATAHACLSYILLAFDWGWAGAERASRRSIELAPNIPGGHHARSQWCLVDGSRDDAINEARKALELDPLSLANQQNLAIVYDGLRRYELAIEQLQNILKIEPAFAPAREHLDFTYAAMGKYEEAFTQLGEPGPLGVTDPRSIGVRGCWGIMTRHGRKVSRSALGVG